MTINRRYDKIVLIIILVSAIIRSFIAGFIDFGNDEVYYWTYALYPALSHFDHPPMLGWVIQVFSLNLTLDSEFFIRLGSIILGTVNIWIIYLIAIKLKNHKVGLYTVLLYISSIYCSVIAGIFILPDAPQTFFWLMSLYLLIQVVSKQTHFERQKKYLIYAGFTIGLAMLSKYTSVFLWGGFGLYILFFERKWFKTKTLYLSILVTALVSLPLIIWNVQNDFISFSFHGARILTSNVSLNYSSFLREFSGEIMYNNPLVVLVTFVALIAIIRKRLNIQTEYQQLILFLTVPFILAFWGVSFFRTTLPHWTGPAYMSLLIFPAIWLAQKFPKSDFPWPLKLSVVLVIAVLIFGVGQVNYGWISLDHATEMKTKGKSDFSLDMYGWDQVKDGFEEILNNDTTISAPNIIVQRWFPAAHLDYYVARPLGIKLYALGNLERIHKYAWINQKRGGIQKGMSAYYLTMSNDFNDPEDFYADDFEKIEFINAIPVIRNKQIVKYAFVYHLINLQQLPDYYLRN